MNWTPSEEQIARARANGVLVTANSTDEGEPWFDVFSADGRYLADAQGFTAAKTAARTQLDDGEAEVYVIAPDGESVLRGYVNDDGAVAWKFGDTIRKWDGRAAA